MTRRRCWCSRAARRGTANTGWCQSASADLPSGCRLPEDYQQILTILASTSADAHRFGVDIREGAGARSEAQSYRNVAQAAGWFGHPNVQSRVVTEVGMIACCLQGYRGSLPAAYACGAVCRRHCLTM